MSDDMDMGLSVLSGRPVIRVVGPYRATAGADTAVAVAHAGPRGSFGGGMPVTGADLAWVSSETVMEAGKTFDSDLRNFVEETNENPNFGKRGYLQAPPDQKKTHEAFITALSSLEYDWWGVSNGNDQVWADAIVKGRKAAGIGWDKFHDDNDVLEAIYKPEELGFYERLRIRQGKTLTTIGAAELAAINGFRSRLKLVMDGYKGLGYNLLTKLSPEPIVPKTPADAALSAAKWIGGGAAVIGVAYLAWRFLPSFSKPAMPAIAPTLPTGAHP